MLLHQELWKENFDKILVMIMYGHTQVLILSQLSSFLHERKLLFVYKQ